MKSITRNLEPKIQELRSRYERFLPAAFFVLGLLFDILTTDRIDHWIGIVQQGLYLIIIAGLLSSEVLETRGPLTLPNWLMRVWPYRDEAVHFLFGSLLSSFAIFYFKSASILNSFLFLSLILILLLANELHRFKSLGLIVRFALYSLCLVSYLAYLVPILLGYVGLLPFLLAIFLSAGLMILLLRQYRKSQVEKNLLVVRILRPTLAVHVIFLLLYLFQLIPPVPISLKYIGVYHRIEKESGKFLLSYERPWWKIWQNGAQTFIARPGDKIHCYVQIFSPTGFKDQVRIRWFLKGRRGWEGQDSIPLEISGGRDEGFRGYTVKQNYQPGAWRVQIETTDGREIGRIYFDLIAGEPLELREFRTDRF